MNPNLSPTPPRATPGHRRAHSDTSFRFSDDLDDDFLFDIDNFNISSLDIPPSPPPVPAKSEESSGGGGGGGGADTGSSSRIQTPSHLRSLSVDADFFDGLSFAGDGEGGGVRKHRRTNSMDGGGGSFSSMMDVESCVDGVKKAMPPERLAELALIDPKRAKRILANRQSAARSKERKIKYTSELERKVQTLQTEATTLSAQVTLLQRDTSGLSVENKELKLRLKSLEQQAQLRDALNEALRQEVQRLRLATGQIPSGSSHPSSRGIPPQFSMQLQNLPHFGSQQNQQQPHAQHQFQPRQQQSTQSQNLPPFGGPQNQQQSQQQSQQQPQLQPRQQQSPQLQNIPPFGGQQNQQQSQQQPRLQQLLQQQQFQLPNQPPSGHQQLKPNFMDFNHRV